MERLCRAAVPPRVGGIAWGLDTFCIRLCYEAVFVLYHGALVPIRYLGGEHLYIYVRSIKASPLYHV